MTSKTYTTEKGVGRLGGGREETFLSTQEKRWGEWAGRHKKTCTRNKRGRRGTPEMYTTERRLGGGGG